MRKYSKRCLVIVMQPSCAPPPPRSTCISRQSASFSHSQTAVGSFLSLRSIQRLTTIPTLLQSKVPICSIPGNVASLRTV